MSKESRNVVTLKYPKRFLEVHGEACDYWEDRISKEGCSNALRDEMAKYNFYFDTRNRIDYDASHVDLYSFLVLCEFGNVNRVSINYDVNEECYIVRVEDDYKEGEFKLRFDFIAKKAGVDPFEVMKTGDFTWLDKLVWYPEQEMENVT